MINQLLLWYLAIPILLSVAVFGWLRKKERIDIAIKAASANFVVCVLILLVGFYGSRAAATSDVEIWNGQVVSKDRQHGEYQRSYDCRCRTETRGSGKDARTERVCDTCYEDRYTVTWTCQTTIGNYTIEALDKSSRSVYNTPDPARFASIQPGDPVAKRSSYTNYVQAVPESLFKPSSESLRAQFANLVPAYPDAVYDFYRLDRFLTPGHSVADAAQWNEDISKLLRELGPRKQVNAIVVVAKTSDANYEFALRDAWDGANKNDVVLVIGSETWPKIDFVRVLTWSKAEMFKIELRDSVLALNEVSREPVLGLLAAQINKNFERRQMAEFEYLEAEIDPPSWVIWTVLALMLCVSGGLIFAFEHQRRQFRPRHRTSFR